MHKSLTTKKKTPTLNYRNYIENVCTLNNNIVLPQQNENHPAKKKKKTENLNLNSKCLKQINFHLYMTFQ